MNVLVVAAHPDDETLGCGGTIAGHAAAGDTVQVLFLADGVGARGGHDAAAIASRNRAAADAATTLGAEAPRSLGLPDNRLDTVPLLDIVKPIEALVAELAPAVVYTHHGGDLNIDHRIAHRAVLTACRPLPESPVRAIHAFEVPSSSEWADAGDPFVPARFVDIGETFATKMAALACYGDEMRAFPHPRSSEAIEALARWRGASAGLALAEAFAVVREVERR